MMKYLLFALSTCLGITIGATFAHKQVQSRLDSLATEVRAMQNQVRIHSTSQSQRLTNLEERPRTYLEYWLGLWGW